MYNALSLDAALSRNAELRRDSARPDRLMSAELRLGRRRRRRRRQR